MVLQMSEAKEGARRMLTMEQVLELVPVGKSTLKRMIKNREFPRPHYISPKKPIWYDDEIELWQGALPDQLASKRESKRKPG